MINVLAIIGASSSVKFKIVMFDLSNRVASGSGTCRYDKSIEKLGLPPRDVVCHGGKHGRFLNKGAGLLDLFGLTGDVRQLMAAAQEKILPV